MNCSFLGLEMERVKSAHKIDSPTEQHECIEDIDSIIIEHTRPDTTQYEKQFIECLILMMLLLLLLLLRLKHLPISHFQTTQNHIFIDKRVRTRRTKRMNIECVCRFHRNY